MRILPLTTDEGRNDVDAVVASPPPHHRELLSLTNPKQQRRTKHLSFMVVLASALILILFSSIRIGIFAGYRIIDMNIKTTAGLSSESGKHLEFEEKSITMSRNPNQLANESVLSAEEVDNDINQLGSCNFNEFIRRFKPEELEINCNNFSELKMGKIKGKGTARKVTQATWQGSKVAVKEFFDSNYGRETTLKEASVSFQLRESENIVRLVGMCNWTMVFEYAPTTLEDLVYDKKKEISVGWALSLGLDVVKGLAQLHSIANGPIIHGDIEIDQYLISSKGRALLGDFDAIKYAGLDKSGKKCTYYRGYSEWYLRAPEILAQKHALDEKTDIYEIALVLWTLFARKPPYKNMVGNDIKERIIAGERPDLTLLSKYPHEIKDLIVTAWDGNPSKRPSATQLVKRMENILENYLEDRSM